MSPSSQVFVTSLQSRESTRHISLAPLMREKEGPSKYPQLGHQSATALAPAFFSSKESFVQAVSCRSDCPALSACSLVCLLACLLVSPSQLLTALSSPERTGSRRCQTREVPDCHVRQLAVLISQSLTHSRRDETRRYQRRPLPPTSQFPLLFRSARFPPERDRDPESGTQHLHPVP